MCQTIDHVTREKGAIGRIDPEATLTPTSGLDFFKSSPIRDEPVDREQATGTSSACIDGISGPNTGWRSAGWHELRSPVLNVTAGFLSGAGNATNNCTSRRCLANELVNKKLITQPQRDNCSEYIFVSSIEYQTIKVDTKNLRLGCRLRATIEWTDDDLYWDPSVYPFNEVILPVSKVWTPDIFVTNGISSSTQNSFRDLIVFSNGTLRHRVVMAAEVNCEFNLFNYPFAEDECPVAIQTWSTQGCGTTMEIGQVEVYDGSHGEWETLGAYLHSTDDRYYISVILKIRQQNPFITLLLPSILLILADMVSFALPLGCGERNSFKVTLVLSFTMFLLILNDHLPGDSECGPVIKNHFCVCLVMLVVSMLVSMVLTRVAKDGGLVFCCSSGRAATAHKPRGADREIKAGVSVIQLDNSEDGRMHQKLSDFLDAIKAKEAERERNEAFADKMDKAFFWFYFFLGTLYFCAMITVMVKYECNVNHLDFW
ncbi:5-hydroxytryptamine receptor 3A-like [Syngnathoides biaculeatus]|uniref:5-hydroxytryptamine receptor 3A-like n=1 Tax=Syngnathoides biaculeatus TaxID=300417 RepID=UPI002ADE3309|nr:5-hydroxytryptamine receptor 3A-like [Syngnathoides biaculeatus]